MDDSERPFIHSPGRLNVEEWKRVISYNPAVAAKCVEGDSALFSAGTYCNYKNLLFRSGLLKALGIHDRDVKHADIDISCLEEAELRSTIVPPHIVQPFVHYL